MFTLYLVRVQTWVKNFRKYELTLNLESDEADDSEREEDPSEIPIEEEEDDCGECW